MSVVRGDRPLRRPNMRRDQGPFGIGQIGRVAKPFALMPGTVLRGPHKAPPEQAPETETQPIPTTRPLSEPTLSISRLQIWLIGEYHAGIASLTAVGPMSFFGFKPMVVRSRFVAIFIAALFVPSARLTASQITDTVVTPEGLSLTADLSKSIDASSFPLSFEATLNFDISTLDSPIQRQPLSLEKFLDSAKTFLEVPFGNPISPVDLSGRSSGWSATSDELGGNGSASDVDQRSTITRRDVSALLLALEWLLDFLWSPLGIVLWMIAGVIAVLAGIVWLAAVMRNQATLRRRVRRASATRTRARNAAR